MKSPIIEINNLSYRRNQTDILKQINWTILEGDHWGLLGLNGSGKSSLIKIISGYDFPSTGQIKVLGETFGKTSLPELRKRIGLVSGWVSNRLPQHETVLRTIISGEFASMGIYQPISEKSLAQAEAILNEFHFSTFKDRKLNTLSQGELQKVLIMRALMTDPDLMILDEPLNSLDLFAREELLDFLEEVAHEKPLLSQLMISHHVEEMSPMYGQIALLKDGEMFEQGARDLILTEDKLNAFYDQEILISAYGQDRIQVRPKAIF